MNTLHMITLYMNTLISTHYFLGWQILEAKAVVRLRTMSAAVAVLPVIFIELVKPSTMTFRLWGTDHCQVIIISNNC